MDDLKLDAFGQHYLQQAVRVVQELCCLNGDQNEQRYTVLRKYVPKLVPIFNSALSNVFQHRYLPRGIRLLPKKDSKTLTSNHNPIYFYPV